MGGKVGIEMGLGRIEPECSEVEVGRVLRDEKAEMVIGRLIEWRVILVDGCDQTMLVDCGTG